MIDCWQWSGYLSHLTGPASLEHINSTSLCSSIKVAWIYYTRRSTQVAAWIGRFAYHSLCGGGAHDNSPGPPNLPQKLISATSSNLIFWGQYSSKVKVTESLSFFFFFTHSLTLSPSLFSLFKNSISPWIKNGRSCMMRYAYNISMFSWLLRAELVCVQLWSSTLAAFWEKRQKRKHGWLLFCCWRCS